MADTKRLVQSHVQIKRCEKVEENKCLKIK
jgi:hypothetical protein